MTPVATPVVVPVGKLQSGPTVATTERSATSWQGLMIRVNE